MLRIVCRTQLAHQFCAVQEHILGVGDIGLRAHVALEEQFLQVLASAEHAGGRRSSRGIECAQVQ